MLLKVPESTASAHPIPGARNFAAFLLFPSDGVLDEARILDALTTRAGNLGAPLSVSPTTERRLRERGVTGTFRRRLERVTLDVTLADVRLSVRISDGPGDRTYWSRFIDGETWPDAFQALGRERAYVSILEHGDANNSKSGDAAYDRALATTLTADVVSGLDEMLAVLWHPARQALPPERFYRAIRPLQNSQSPLELWACLRPVQASGADYDGVMTEGLLPILGREIEVPPSRIGTKRAARIAVELAAALIDGQASVSDGDAWTAEQQQMRVSSATSGTAGVPVWQLRPMAVAAA